MEKEEIQGIILNQVALTCLIQCRLDAIDRFLTQSLSSSQLNAYEIEKHNQKVMQLSLASVTEFLSDLPEQNQIVRERLKELFEIFY